MEIHRSQCTRFYCYIVSKDYIKLFKHWTLESFLKEMSICSNVRLANFMCL